MTETDPLAATAYEWPAMTPTLLPEADAPEVEAPPIADLGLYEMAMSAELRAAADEISALLPFWEHAASLGWKVDVDPEHMTWTVESPDRSAGAGYRPPGEVCTGQVNAYDATGKTITLTGIETNAEAVARVRGFFGWVEEGS